MKKTTASLKRRSADLQQQISQLEGSLGLFAKKDLLRDYYLSASG